MGHSPDRASCESNLLRAPPSHVSPLRCELSAPTPAVEAPAELPHKQTARPVRGTQLPVAKSPSTECRQLPPLKPCSWPRANRRKPTADCKARSYLPRPPSSPHSSPRRAPESPPHRSPQRKRASRSRVRQLAVLVLDLLRRPNPPVSPLQQEKERTAIGKKLATGYDVERVRSELLVTVERDKRPPVGAAAAPPRSHRSGLLRVVEPKKKNLQSRET